MLHKCLVLPLILCLLLGSACAAPPPPPPQDLAVLSQSDPLFDSDDYRYWNEPFRSAACAPASLSNAFNAALGTTDRQQAADITLDLLHLTTYGSDQVTMDFLALEHLTSLPASQYPALTSTLRDWDGLIGYFSSELSSASIAGALAQPNQKSRLLIAPHNQLNRYQTVCHIAYSLYHSGHKDATLTLAMLAAGTDETDGAFRTTAGGHYVSLYVPVQEFCETGAVYLLESYPRCIKGETPGEKYATSYDFVVITYDTLALHTFNTRCTVERMTDTILRITPAQPLGSALLMHPQPTDALHAYERYLTTMGFSNKGKLFIHVPGTPGS